MQGLIIENKANLYKVKVNEKEYIATARGKFKNENTSPVVGDMVEISILEEQKNTAVIEEIKTSSATKASCLACKFGINLMRQLMVTGKSDQEILSLASLVCSTLNIQTPRVCSGFMDLIGVSLFFTYD